MHTLSCRRWLTVAVAAVAALLVATPAAAQKKKSNSTIQTVIDCSNVQIKADQLGLSALEFTETHGESCEPDDRAEGGAWHLVLTNVTGTCPSIKVAFTEGESCGSLGNNIGAVVKTGSTCHYFAGSSGDVLCNAVVVGGEEQCANPQGDGKSQFNVSHPPCHLETEVLALQVDGLGLTSGYCDPTKNTPGSGVANGGCFIAADETTHYVSLSVSDLTLVVVEKVYSNLPNNTNLQITAYESDACLGDPIPADDLGFGNGNPETITSFNDGSTCVGSTLGCALGSPLTITTGNITNLTPDADDNYQFGYQASVGAAISGCEAWPIAAGGRDEWCSPGFWRNAADAAWAHTGINRNADYNTVLSALCTAYPSSVPKSKPAACASLTSTPTLQQVLDHPQCYGGAAFNAVGNVLSAAADFGFVLDCDTIGEGIQPHECPINRHGACEICGGGESN